METGLEGVPRVYRLRRSQHLGYGFIVGSEFPTIVKLTEPNGPSFKQLLRGDVIMAVNGVDVEEATRDQIIKMIQMSEDEIEIKVRQPSYEDIIRAKNLADPKFYMFNKSDQLTSTNSNTLHSAHSLNNMQHRKLPSPLESPTLPPNKPFAINRPARSINHQQPAQTTLLQEANNCQDITHQVQAKQSSKMVLKQRTNDNENVSSMCDLKNNNLIMNGTATLGRRGPGKKQTDYGRHSPLPQRCKSSLDKFGKKSGDIDNDQPMLKRSNTMRPIRPPAKVMEIFEVVIRIFFEDGHTKVMNYNQNTTVAVILESLNDRLLGSSPHSDVLKRYFGLVLTVNSEGNIKDQPNKRKFFHLLDENDSIMKIRQLPYAPKLRLLYRMIYPPNDLTKLYAQSKVAFDYLYKQSCNDLRFERFNPELEPDCALKLVALHIVEYVYSNHPKEHSNSKDARLYMRLVKKTPGLSNFVPISMIDQTGDKKVKKSHYKRLKSKLLDQLKKNFEELDFEPPKVRSTTNLNHYTSTSFHELALPELQSSPSDCVKLLFLNFLSQLPCYGNTKRPVRSSASPIEHNSVGDCSSSMESVPRTSDSSPLLRQDRNPAHINSMKPDMTGTNTISRLAHMNSMRSLNSSIQPPNSTSVTRDQVDMAQTPSIDSISSITFNMQSSPSPPQTISHASQPNEGYLFTKTKPNFAEPSPMPRQQIGLSRAQDYNSIETIYSMRYQKTHARSIDELLKSAVLSPPPPTPFTLIGDFTNHRMAYGSITPILTDRDLDRLKVPPPPPRITHH